MTAPNIVNVSTITGKTGGAALGTTSNTAILTNSAASGKVYKVNSLLVANVNGTDAANLNVNFNDSSAATRYKIANTISVPADATLVVIDKNSAIYLEEGDILEAWAGTSSYLEAVFSYEEIS